MKRTPRNNVSNKKQVKSKGMLLGLLLLLVIAAIGGYYVLREEQMLELEIALWVCLVVVVLLFKWGGYCYVEIEVEKGNLDVKYYDLFPIGRKYKRILIPISKIHQVKINPGLFGLGRSLVVTRKSRGQKINYPSVGLAAFNKDQLGKLEKIIRQNVDVR